MKRFIPIAVALFIALPGLCAQGNANDLNIVYLDSQRFLDESIAGKDANAQMMKIQNEKRKEVEKMQESIKKLDEEIRTKGPTMKEGARAELQAKLESEAKSLNRYVKDADEELKRKYMILIKPIQDDLNKIIDDYGKQNGIDIIFDTKAPGGMVYNSKKADITDAILKIYDAKQKKPKEKK